MKLSFSLASKLQKKPTSTNLASVEDSNNNNRDYLTEFDSSKVSGNSSHHSKNLVIQPIQNQWRPEKRMKNLHLPLQSDDGGNQELQFVLESTSSSAIDPAESSMAYGLNLRRGDNVDSDVATEPKGKVEDLLLHKLKEDLETLPEDNGFDGFDEVPVEGFGRALLAGYGWQEGRGIGRGWDKKQDVKVVEIQRRTAKEGLGFTAELPKLAPKSNDGKKISNKDDNVEVRKQKNGGLDVGKVVRIIRGKNMGLKGRLVELKRDGYVVLSILKSEDEVRVRVSDVADLGSVEEDICLKKLKELRAREAKEFSKRKKEAKSSVEGVKGTRIKESKVLWLRSNIRVRIISKELKGGRFYLKKGEVLDVVGPTTCDISMDESRELIQGVDQDLLETAIPRRGGNVIVLYGRHKGVYGSLVEKDTEKETGVVRDIDTHELINVRLEQIAEYVGDPTDIGY